MSGGQLTYGGGGGGAGGVLIDDASNPFFQPQYVAMSPDGVHAYVVNRFGDVTVVKLSDMSVVAVVPTGFASVWAAVTPDDAHVYVANYGSLDAPGTMSVIRTSDNTVTDTITIGSNPFVVMVSPDGAHVYVLSIIQPTGPGDPPSFLTVIQTSSNTIVATISTLQAGATAMAVAPNGAHVYVSGEAGTLDVVATSSNTVVATISSMNDAEAVVVKSDSTTVYVLDANSSGQVDVVDASTNTVTTTVTVGAQPRLMVITPDDAHLYVYNRLDLTLSVVATSSNTVVATITLPGTPGTSNYSSLAVSPDGAHVYVGTQDAARHVVVVATSSNTVVATPDGPLYAYFVAVTNDSAHALVAGFSDNSVWVLTASGNTTEKLVALQSVGTFTTLAFDGSAITDLGGGAALITGPQLQSQPFAQVVATADYSYAVVSPDGAFVYVGNNDNTSLPVYVFETSTGKFVTAISVGVDSTFMAITPDGSRVYASSYYSSDVWGIYTTTNEVITFVTGLSSPCGVVITPDGVHGYVAEFGANRVTKFLVSNSTIITSISTGTQPLDLVISPDGSKIYVLLASDATNAVQVIQTSTDTVVASISNASLGSGSPVPHGLAMLPNGAEVYVGVAGAATVRRISTSSNTITGSAITLDYPITDVNGSVIVPSPDGSIVYVTLGTNTIDAIDTTTHAVTAIVTPGTSNAIAVNPVFHLLYSLLQPISVIDTDTRTAVGTVDSFATPQAALVGAFKFYDILGAVLTDQGDGIVRFDFPVAFNDHDPTAQSNIQSNRLQQSSIDNTKNGITNFGSFAGDANPDATGATDIYATISGGLDNSAGSGGGSTVAGGFGNTASGEAATVSGGNSNSATSDYTTIGGGENNQALGGTSTVGGGHGNNAQGTYSTVSGGFGNVAKGDHSYAEGASNTANGDAAHAEGSSTLAEGDGSHAEGSSTQANGASSHAEGNSAVANSFASHAEGDTTNAAASAAHAEGSNTSADGNAAHAEGHNTFAEGDYSHSSGVNSAAGLVGQRAHGSGPGSTSGLSGPGKAQESVVVLAGKTPGSTSGESVELDFGDSGSSQLLSLENYVSEMGVTVMVTAVARGTIGGSTKIQSFRQMFCLKSDSGTVVLIASGSQEQIGDSGAASWTLAGAASASPYGHFALTFTTGSTTAAVKVVAKCELVEVSSS